jgi:DNA repair protein RecO (recombination protein O)
MAADAIADTILATHGGGGNWEEALSLADSSLDALENAGEPLCVRIFIHFLWNWANILGLRPELGRCGSCAAINTTGAAIHTTGPDGLLWYDQREGIFLCSSCAGISAGDVGRLLPFNAGGQRWLATVEDLPGTELGRYSLDTVSLRQTRAIVTAIMAEILGKQLNTWNF